MIGSLLMEITALHQLKVRVILQNISKNELEKQKVSVKYSETFCLKAAQKK
jgi:hypothetical protein